MKREYLAAVLCMAVAVGAACAEGTNPPAETAKPPAGPAPKLQFDSTVYDFGATSLVESVTGTFTFHNAGDAELKLQKPVPSCGCTVASVKPDVLKPGEKGELVFTLRLGGNRGHVEKHINVPSNDPQSPNINLAIKTELVQILEVTPAQVMIGDIRQGTTTNVTVQVRRTDGKALSILKAEVTGNSVLRARVEPWDTNQTAKVIIEVVGEGQPRRFSDQVKISIDGNTQVVASIPVQGQLMGDVNITPEQVFWGIPDPERWPGTYPEAMTTRRITVTAGQPGKPLEIQNVTSSLKEVSIELVTVEKGKTYILVAKLTVAPKEPTRGTISFDTNVPSQPKIVVPVTINVLKR